MQSVEIITDGSRLEVGFAGSAAIIRTSKFLPIKLLCYLGKVESSKAELWGAILGFSICNFLELTSSNLIWVSDSKTSQISFSRDLNTWIANSWHNKSGIPPVHIEDWKTIELLTRNSFVCCIHKLRSKKHRDLSSCDKASRWAAKLQEISTQKSLQGKNVLKDPRYSWQAVDVASITKLKSEDRVEKLNELFNSIKLYCAT